MFLKKQCVNDYRRFHLVIIPIGQLGLPRQHDAGTGEPPCFEVSYQLWTGDFPIGSFVSQY